MVPVKEKNLTLKTKAERFEQLFNNSGVGIFIVNKDRVIIEGNKAFCNIFGYEYDEIINQLALTLHLSYAAYVNFAQVAFNRVRENQALNLEHPFLHKSGKKIWLRIAGDSIPSNEEVLWTITDITSNIEAKNKLRESENLLRNAESISHVGSWEIIIDENLTMKWSEEMFYIYGEDPETFVPSLEKMERFLDPEDFRKIKTINKRAIHSGSREELDYMIKRKDGKKVFIKTYRKAIYDENGKTLRLVGTSLDITKQKENEEKIAHLNKTLQYEVKTQLKKLREQDRQLQYQSRLVQMGEMLSMVAHQWRQPLGAISATTSYLFAKLALGEFDKDGFHKEVENIEGYVSHLSRTIDDFRNFFKSTKEKERVSLENIVERTLKIANPILSTKSIIIEKEFECKQKIDTFGNELAQAVLNILKNAEDALYERKVKNPRVWIRTYSEENFTCLEIKDNAGGIKDEVFEKIFQPYISTKLGKDGTGIGLWMSKTIVEEHCSGSLLAHNHENGAVFTIKLPLY